MFENTRGTTLFELLLAVVIITIGVVILSLVFPKASANVTNNRHRFLASNFAAAKIQEVKEQPYALIAVTPSGTTADYFGGTAAGLPLGGTPGPGIQGCDCSIVDWDKLATFPPYGTPDVYVEDSVTYNRQVCINLADRNPGPPPDWNSFCPNDPLTPAMDRGLKNIRVHVWWKYGATTYTYDTESMVTR